jgi:excisionase family DNA binding protein
METTKLTQVYGLNPEELTQKIVTALELLFSHQNTSTKVEENKEEKLFTRNEASKYLKVSKTTLNNWSKLGILKKHKIGNMVRYKESELQEALYSKRH